MSQRGIEIGCLLRYLQLGLHILCVANLPHQVHTVGNHNQDHAHILGKRQQQVTEILALDDGILLIELLDAVQTVQDARHLRAILRLDLLQRQIAFIYLGNQHNSL